MRHFIFVLTLIPSSLFSQNPVLFEQGLISNNGVFGFTLSPKGDHALWVQSNGGRDTLMIFESYKVNGQWQTPKPAPFSGNPAIKDIDPIFTPDGKAVLFQSTRPVESQPKRTGFDIYKVNKTKSGWSDVIHLGDVINTDVSESFASMAKNGNIYFMKANEDGKGQSDIYVSRFINGSYQTPENLGLPINTSERESNPYISPDEDYLLYFSSSPRGFGEVDLYISRKTKSGWSEGENLGQPINSTEAEFCPFYHSKEKRLYFSRQKKNGTRFIENIYFVDYSIKN